MTREERHRTIIQMIAGTMVGSETIAAKTGVCVRTVYRDVRALKDEGWRILSGPGKGSGYMLRKQVRS